MFLKRSHRRAQAQESTGTGTGTPMWHTISESPGHILSLEINPAWPRLAQLRKLKNFFQPAGFFTEMLRFDKKFQRNLLATLKIALLIKKCEFLEKNRKNKIFIISGFNGGHRNDKKSPG
jgi:hypothetical protein